MNDNGRGKGSGPLLTDDGISEEFFDLLWQKDELNFAPAINIPDTIIFKYGQPVNWYFTAQSGRIKKKNRANLIGARIEEAFTKYILGYDIIASFISVPIHSESDGPDHPTTTIEFLDREGLTKFLYNRKKEDSNGILQRFIEPKGVKNELIRAVWSPKLVLLERSENIHQLHDHRYGLYERCVTLEGPEYYANSAPLRGPVLAGQIQKICENVVSHIAEVTFGQKQVTRAVLNFKVDSRDKIWLVYSTSIRINDMLVDNTRDSGGSVHRQLVNIDNVVELPDNINLNPVPTFEKVVAKKRIQCISCGLETLNDMRHPVTYKMVIKHYEHVLHIMSELSGNRGSPVAEWPPDEEVIAAAGGVGFGCMEMVASDDAMRRAGKLDINKPLNGTDLHIPPVLRYLHPKLTGKSYIQCRKDPLFLYKTATICEPCYLVYAEFTTMLLRMGGDLNKILAPDPAALRTLQESSVSTSNTRPSSADWRAMSSVHRSTDSVSHGRDKFQPSKNHTMAKRASIGLRSSDARQQPNIPRAIRKIDDAEPLQTQYSVDSYGSMMQIPSHINTQMSLNRSATMGQLGNSQTFGGSSDAFGSLGNNYYGSSGAEAADLSSIIKEREKHFFNEIATNPQLKSQHPLMHLISAQQKLKMADDSSGIMASKGRTHKMPLFGTKYGQQTDGKYEPLDVIYGKEQPYMFKGERILPSEYKRQKQEKIELAKKAKNDRLRRKQARNAELYGTGSMESSLNMEGSLSPGNSVLGSTALAASLDGEVVNLFDEAEVPGGDITSTKSAKKHRDFLRDTLRQLEVEVDKSASFLPGGEFHQENKEKGSKKKDASSKASAAAVLSSKVQEGVSKAVGPMAAINVMKPDVASKISVKSGDKNAATAQSSLSQPSSNAEEGKSGSVGMGVVIQATPSAIMSASEGEGGDDNLDSFFKLAAAGGMPQRIEAKSAGLRDLRTADSSRPSTTATGRRDDVREGLESRELGLDAIGSMGLGPTSPVQFESKSLPRIASDGELLEMAAHAHSNSNGGHSQSVKEHSEPHSGTHAHRQTEIVSASASNSAIDVMESDSSTAHLLTQWGADSVHNGGKSESLL